MFLRLYDLYAYNNPSNVAFKNENIVVSYGNLLNSVEMISRRLAEILCGKKGRFLFLENPSIELSIAYLSLVNAGALCFFLPPNSDNIEELEKKYEIDVVVSEEIKENRISLNQLLNLDFSFYYSNKNVDVYESCTAFFTSGTSGEPKCVLLSEKNLCSNVVAGCKELEYSSKDVHLCTLPFYHAYGITCTLLAPLYTGGTLCFGKSIATFFKDLKIFKPTFIQTVPMILKSMLAYQKNNFITVKKILSGGANTPKELIEEFRRLGVAVYSCYGMTECSPCISCNDNRPDKDCSVGRVLCCNNIKIIDDEILLNGTNIMIGYYGEERINGWFKTGDCGYLDDEGYLYLTGRKTGCFKLSNGEKVYLEEIENVVNKFPNIIESRASCTNDSIIIEIFALEQLITDKIKSFIESEFNHSIVIKKIIQVEKEFPKTSIMKIKR